MSKPRRIGLDELTIRPGTYFNPQTEILIVVDDSPEIAHEIFDGDEFDGAEWVMISEDTALDESKRDELIETFQLAHQAGGEPLDDDYDETTRTTSSTRTRRTSSRRRGARPGRRLSGRRAQARVSPAGCATPGARQVFAGLCAHRSRKAACVSQRPRP